MSLAAAAVLFLLSTAVLADDPVSTLDCFITKEEPTMPETLTFCHKFNNKACCPPAMDAEVNEMFNSLTDLGLSCRIRGNVRTQPMAKLYCMTCDPDQPSYVRMEPYVPLLSKSNIAPWKLGDICTGKDCEYDFSAFPDTKPTPIEKREMTILICKEWAEKEFGSTQMAVGHFLENYDRCGLKKSAPCTDAAETIIPGRDRYTCGDDLIIPSRTYESLEEFFNIESMGPPQLDEEFGFKLVENRQCTDAELEQLEGDAAKLRPSNDLHSADQFNKFNPNCLRTKRQIQKYNVSKYSPWFGDSQLADAVDEMCFASAAWARPLSLVSVLVLAAATLFLVL